MPRPTLKKRKDGRYACRYKNKFFYGSTQAEAYAARDRYKREEASAKYETVEDYALRWLPIAHPAVSDATMTGLRIHLNKLIDQIGHMALSEVLPTDIKTIYSTCYKDASSSYIKAAKQLFTALFDAAVADGFCARNPAREKSAAPHKGTFVGHRAITPQERDWILTLCTDHRAHAAVMVMLYAGLRPQEAKAMNIDESVDFDAGTISLKRFAHYDGTQKYKITTKGKTPKATRVVPLLSPLRPALENRHGLLISSAHGQPVTRQTWKTAWLSYVNSMEAAINGMQKRWYGRTRAHKAILASGGELPPWVQFTVKPYDLRHSFAAMCRDNGVELNTVVRWMGHADAKMVLKVYDEVSEDRSKSEAEKLEKTLESSQNGSQK